MPYHIKAPNDLNLFKDLIKNEMDLQEESCSCNVCAMWIFKDNIIS